MKAQVTFKHVQNVANAALITSTAICNLLEGSNTEEAVLTFIRAEE